MKYKLVTWPEIQGYMNHPDYKEDCYFCAEDNVWFVPEDWEESYGNNYYKEEVLDIIQNLYKS